MNKKRPRVKPLPFTSVELRHHYINKQMTQGEIAKAFHVSPGDVAEAMKEWNIPPRKAISRNPQRKTVKAFLANLEKKGDCVEWTGARDPNGYGRVTWGNGTQLCHRIMWEIVNGDIPRSLCVLHKCDNPACVEPDHLFLGTQLDNIADMIKKGRNLVPRKLPRGSNHHNAKVTEQDVRFIRSSGCGPTELAKQFGITKENVSCIVSRKTWRHV